VCVCVYVWCFVKKGWSPLLYTPMTQKRSEIIVHKTNKSQETSFQINTFSFFRLSFVLDKCKLSPLYLFITKHLSHGRIT